MSESKPNREDKVYVPGRSGKYLGGSCFGRVQIILWDKSGDGMHEVVVRFNNGEQETFDIWDFNRNHRGEWWQNNIYNEGAPPHRYPAPEGTPYDDPQGFDHGRASDD